MEFKSYIYSTCFLLCLIHKVVLQENNENESSYEEAPPQFMVVANDSIKAREMKYFLYTRQNPQLPQTINNNDAYSLEVSNFSNEKKTKIIIHGWVGHAFTSVNTLSRDGDDHFLNNLIFFDHRTFGVDLQNTDTPQVINITNVSQTHFSYAKKTKIIIHGWIGNEWAHTLAPYYKAITQPFLQLYDVNVICVDWSQDANEPYDVAVLIAPSVGKEISSFIDFLITLGAKADSFHIIGYSLGAQVAGAAARYTKLTTIDYLTGLDPAKDHWQNSTECISKKDAKYVEIIHTNTRGYGLHLPTGHNDFYPNGGVMMPGCVDDGCSHARSYEYFAESIDHNGFMAQQCANYEEAVAGNCNERTKLYMGGSNPKKPFGLFHLETNAVSPYHKSPTTAQIIINRF